MRSSGQTGQPSQGTLPGAARGCPRPHQGRKIIRCARNFASLTATGLVRVSRARTKVTLRFPHFVLPRDRSPLHRSHLLPSPGPAPVVSPRRLPRPSPGERTGGSIPPERETKAKARWPGGQASSGTAAGRMGKC